MLQPNRTFVEWRRSRPTAHPRQENESVNRSHKILSSFYDKLYQKPKINSCSKKNAAFNLIDFHPPWYLRSPHIQTLLSTTRPTSRFVYDRYVREIVHFDDGGISSMDWFEPPSPSKNGDNNRSNQLPEDAPIVFLLHGLTGGSHEAYVTHFIECLVSRLHCRCVVINNRGCADTPLKSGKLFNAATTDDIQHCLEIIRSRYPQSSLCGIGFSLGSIILVSLLSQIASSPPSSSIQHLRIAGAVSVSNPFDMRRSCLRLIRRPFLRWTYNTVLSRNLKQLAKKHQDTLQLDSNTWEKIQQVKSVYEFDDVFTAPSIHLSNADEYYRLASSSGKIEDVETPLLMLNAVDDPVVDPEGIPWGKFRRSDHVMFLGSYQGGHLGFFDSLPKKSDSPSWSERICSTFLECVLDNEMKNDE